MLSKKRVKNLMPSFSRIKFRMKNIDEHRLAFGDIDSDERLPNSLQKETDSAVERHGIINTRR